MLLSRQEIVEAVERLASEIRRDYAPARGEPVEPQAEGDPPLLVGVLKGAFIFMADLVRALDMPLSVDFVRVSTYRSGTESSGQPRIVQGVRSPIKGRHVLVVEDIVDTGITVRFLTDYLRRRGAASVKLCALLSKPSRRKVEVSIDYLGFTIPDRFVIGYGLD
ncbi:MAG: hypoxanthine phosphoribosyltransferase, partial [Chloroflexi bacterium]|nr:hypoxanthine phosphoribosyltransferase [Chloroflexota bacterium]